MNSYFEHQNLERCTELHVSSRALLEIAWRMLTAVYVSYTSLESTSQPTAGSADWQVPPSLAEQANWSVVIRIITSQGPSIVHDLTNHTTSTTGHLRSSSIPPELSLTTALSVSAAGGGGAVDVCAWRGGCALLTPVSPVYSTTLTVFCTNFFRTKQTIAIISDLVVTLCH